MSKQAAWLLAALLAGGGVFGLVLLQDTALGGVLPRINPDIYLWGGAGLAMLAGAGVVALALRAEPLTLAFGAGSGAAGYGLGYAVLMASLLVGGGYGCAYPEATWHQAGLYDAAHGSPAPDGWTIEPTDARGLPFENASLTEAWGQTTYALTGVSKQGPQVVHGRGGGFSLSLSAPAEVTTRAREAVNETVISKAFGRFAANVTGADEATIRNWTDTFLDSKHLASWAVRVGSDGEPDRRIDIYAYSVNLTEPLELSELYRRVGPPTPSTNLTTEDGDRLPADRVGQAETAAGDWTFTFRFDTVRAEHTDGEGEHLRRVTVDALDRAGAVASLDSSDGYRSRTVTLLEGAFEVLGWPPPSVGEEHVRLGAIC